MSQNKPDVPFVHCQGEVNDFIIYIDNVGEYVKWKTSGDIPIAQVVARIQILRTDKDDPFERVKKASTRNLQREFGASCPQSDCV